MKQLKLELEPRSLDFLFFSPVSFHVLELCCSLFFNKLMLIFMKLMLWEFYLHVRFAPARSPTDPSFFNGKSSFGFESNACSLRII